MRILLIYHALQMGGVDSVVAKHVNHWAAHGQDITLALFSAPGSPAHYALHPGVRVLHLDLFSSGGSPLKRLTAAVRRHLKLRRTIRETAPDMVVSHVDAVNARVLLAARGLKIPVVVTEHTDPNVFRPPWPWSWLRRMLYPGAAKVVVLNRVMREYFLGYLPGDNVLIIPNPLDLGPLDVERDETRTILYLGRLAPEKGVDVLIRAFACCRQEGWSLNIAGDGPLRSQLEGLSRELGVEDDVHFLGSIQDVGPLLARAAIFALPSHFEGFPMALSEAMVCGVPPVATETSGATNLIRDNENGLLSPVGDHLEFSKRLDRLMADDTLRRRLGNAAQRLREVVSIDSVMAQWNQTLRSVRRQKDTR